MRTPCTRTCVMRCAYRARTARTPCAHRARIGAGGGGGQGAELGGAAGDPQEERAVARRGLLDLERGRVGRVEVRCGRRATKGPKPGPIISRPAAAPASTAHSHEPGPLHSPNSCASRVNVISFRQITFSLLFLVFVHVGHILCRCAPRPAPRGRAAARVRARAGVGGAGCRCRGCGRAHGRAPVCVRGGRGGEKAEAIHTEN